MSVATTYAEALYQAALSAGAVDAVAADVAAFAEAVDGSPDLRAVLESPEIDSRAKKAAFATLAAGGHPLVANFLQVLIDRGRIAEFPEIAAAIADRVAEAEDRLEVEAVTAIALPDDLRERIVARIREKTGARVELTEAVDPDILGGLVLRVGGMVVDGSLRHRADELRHALRGISVDAAASAS